MSEYFIYESNDNYEAMVQKEGGVLFLHLDVLNFNKSILKDIQNDLSDVIDMLQTTEHEVIAFVVDDNTGTKFHNMVRRLDFEEKIEDSYIVGGWFVQED